MALHDGSVVSSHFPYLPISLHLTRAGQREIVADFDALVDTGFDGDIILPENLLGIRRSPDAYLTWTLADGSEVESPAYTGYLLVPGLGTQPMPMDVIVSILGDEPIIGRGVTDRMSVTFDHGQRVIASP